MWYISNRWKSSAFYSSLFKTHIHKGHELYAVLPVLDVLLFLVVYHYRVDECLTVHAFLVETLQVIVSTIIYFHLNCKNMYASLQTKLLWVELLLAVWKQNTVCTSVSHESDANSWLESKIISYFCYLFMHLFFVKWQSIAVALILYRFAASTCRQVSVFGLFFFFLHHLNNRSNVI